MILISSCLLGELVRYNGEGYNIELLNKYSYLNKFYSVCPEILGGLAVPRTPAEIIDGKVLTIQGEDVTSCFIKGAEDVLKIVKENNIKYAILKANSPSCGNRLIYDGTFSNNKIDGQGVTTKLLVNQGVIVYSEKELTEELLLDLLSKV